MKHNTKKSLVLLVSLGLLSGCTGAGIQGFNNPIRYADGDPTDTSGTSSADSSSQESSSSEAASSSQATSSETSSSSAPASSVDSSSAPASSSEDSSSAPASSETSSSNETSSSQDSSVTSSETSSDTSSESSSGSQTSSSLVSSDTSSSQDSSSSSSTVPSEDVMIGSVDDWNDFAALCNRDAGYSVNKNVYLRNDLDFANKAFTPISSFQGTFDGNYHALKNVHITGEKDYPSIFHIVNKNGVIKKLDVLDLDIDCQDTDYVGVISKNYGSVYDLKVTGSILGQNYVGIVGLNGVKRTSDNTDVIQNYDATLTRITNQAKISGLSNVGGVCGTNFGSIKDSLNEGKIVATDNNANSTALNIGGIAGDSLGKLDGNENRGEVNMDIQALHVGGIVGKGNGELYFERNYGPVTGTKYVGGICGYYGNVQKNDDDLKEYFDSNDWQEFVDKNADWLKNLGFDVDKDIDDDDFEEKVTTIAFDYSYSDGNINADSDAGGILGISTSTDVKIKEAVSKSDVTLRVGTYGGGIAGNMVGGEIESSIASGHIKGKRDVGGIAGHGLNMKDNLSSALVEGDDHVGGLVGTLDGNMTSNLSNALVVNSDNKSSAGSLAGYVENFDETDDSFAATIEYNYYISELGGIARREYGTYFKDAAKHLSIDEMTTDNGTLSSSFGEGFDKDNYLPGKDADHFPTPKYLSEPEVDPHYGSEAAFKAQYENYAAVYKAAGQYDSKVTCLVTYMEWREEDGDLYDDYGNVDKTHYEITSYEKVPIHETLSKTPDFKYAKKEDDLYIYSGDKNTYIVTWDLPEEEVTQSIIVYASYSERVKTLIYNKNEYVVEGAFNKGTRMEVVSNSSVQNSTIYCVKFYDEDDNELTLKNVTLKIKMSEHPNQVVYYVDGALTSKIDGAKDTSGYFVFRYSSGQYFTFLNEVDVQEELPSWVIPTVVGVITAMIAILILAIGLSIGRKKGIKEEQKANGTYEYHHLVDNLHPTAQGQSEEKKDEDKDTKDKKPDEEKKDDKKGEKK